MEHFVSLEIWAVLAAAPCIISWFLGEMHGAARLRKMIEAEQAQAVPKAIGSAPDFRNSAPLLVKATDVIETDKSKASNAVVATTEERAKAIIAPAPSAPLTVTAPVGHSAQREPVQSRRRREAFDDMPSVAELHAQAELIRESGMVWDDPDLSENLRKTDPISARVLQHYLGSINELARCNAGVDRKILVRADDLSNTQNAEFPRFSDAAPVSLSSRDVKLSHRRESVAGVAA